MAFSKFSRCSLWVSLSLLFVGAVSRYSLWVQSLATLCGCGLKIIVYLSQWEIFWNTDLHNLSFQSCGVHCYVAQVRLHLGCECYIRSSAYACLGPSPSVAALMA